MARDLGVDVSLSKLKTYKDKVISTTDDNEKVIKKRGPKKSKFNQVFIFIIRLLI